MKDNREHDEWPDAATAEALLNGTAAPSSSPPAAALARLLSAASEPLPGRPEDERAALQAFREAQLVAWEQAQAWAQVSARSEPSEPDGAPAEALGTARSATTGGWPAITAGYPAGAGAAPLGRARARSGPRSVKVLIGGAVAVLAFSGVALAAQTGALPHPFRSDGVPGPSLPTAGTASSTTGSGSASGTASRTPSAVDSRGPAPAPSGPATTAVLSPNPLPAPPPSAGTKGLCKAYRNAISKGRTPNPNTMTRLAAAAGGKDQVDAYCAALTSTTPPADASPTTDSPGTTDPSLTTDATDSTGTTDSTTGTPDPTAPTDTSSTSSTSSATGTTGTTGNGAAKSTDPQAKN